MTLRPKQFRVWDHRSLGKPLATQKLDVSPAYASLLPESLS